MNPPTLDLVIGTVYFTSLQGDKLAFVSEKGDKVRGFVLNALSVKKDTFLISL